MRKMMTKTRKGLCTAMVGAVLIVGAAFAGGCEVEVVVDGFGYDHDEYEIKYAIERIVYGVFDIVEWFDD